MKDSSPDIPFLRKVARHLVSKERDMLSLTVVLPNRRAGLFLKKHLAAEMESTFIAPRVMSVEEFIFDLSGYQEADPLSVTFELYHIHREIAGQEARTFEQFSGMAPIMISDFNEIDLSLKEAQDIYHYLSEIKAIQLWNLGREPLSEFQSGYLTFFRSLVEYYEKLNQRLHQKRIAYQGMAYRKALNNLEKGLGTKDHDKLLFCGFNALTAAEEAIIRLLAGQGKAEILWDADPYYLGIRNHEAGRFLKGYFSTWAGQSPLFTEAYLAKGHKEIQITGVPRNVAQARFAGQLIRELVEQGTAPDQIAVVLADENLLIPVLNSIPEVITEMNITMGYPLKFTPMARFFRDLIRIQEEFQERQSKAIYLGHLQRILLHPYARAIYLSGKEELEERAKMMQAMRQFLFTRKIYFQPGNWEEFLSDTPEPFSTFCRLATEPWPSIMAGIEGLSQILAILRDHLGRGERQSLEMEYLFEFSVILKKIASYMAEFEFITTAKAFSKLFTDILQSRKLPFYGEPLKGLQIMGMLETRTLDFKHVILLSANENVLPAGNRFNTFIPFDVKMEKGIRTHHDRDAVYAYHFYRLLQRAEKAYLLYNTENDQFGSGEKSRFLAQLEIELPAANPSVQLTAQILRIPLELGSNDPELSIEKDGAMLDRIRQKADRGFSASSLITYINCSLQFYFRYIAGIREPEEIEETVEGVTLGNVVHDALHEFYSPFRGRRPEADELKLTEEQADTLVKKYFNKHYDSGNLNFGLNLLIFRLARLYFQNVIKLEHDLGKEDPAKVPVILDLEQKLEHLYTLNETDGLSKVRLKGYLDRVDRTSDGVIRVLDYKTGHVDSRKLKKVTLDLLFTDPAYKQAFQLMVYTLLGRKHYGENAEILPGIISLRSLSEGILPVQFDNGQAPVDLLEEFEERLLSLLREIHDPSVSFRQAAETDRCEWCEFKDICNR